LWVVYHHQMALQGQVVFSHSHTMAAVSAFIVKITVCIILLPAYVFVCVFFFFYGIKLIREALQTIVTSPLIYLLGCSFKIILI